MNDCRLRINLIKLWYRTALEERGSGRNRQSRRRRAGCGYLTALRLFPGEVQPVGHPGQIGQRSRLHLSHDLATMDFYGDFADADLIGDLLVETASRHQGHHLTLAGGESLEARPQPGQSFFILQPSAVARDAQLDRVEQILVAEWLGQELDRAALHRPDGHRDVAIPGDEDDWEVDVRGGELSLEVEAASPGQSYIEHQAGRSVRPSGLEEFIYRSEQLRLQPDGSEQAADRLPDCGVIIDYDNGWHRLGHCQRSPGRSQCCPRVLPTPSRAKRGKVRPRG